MKLKKSEEFVKVVDGKNTYYGGHQNWLKYKGISKFFRDRSCVVTAFTNLYFYLYKNDEPLSLQSYNNLQHYFYRRIRPKLNGVATVRSLNKRIWLIKDVFNLKLKAHILEEYPFRKYDLNRKIEFIKKALADDLPVIMINWLSKDVEITNHHGVVITELNEVAGKHEIVVSSWGRAYRFFLEDFDKQFRTYTGFIYFTKE